MKPFILEINKNPMESIHYPKEKKNKFGVIKDVKKLIKYQNENNFIEM